MARAGIGIALVALAALVACSRDDPQLMRLGTDSRSPDEFAILPSKPIEIPAGPVSVAALPAPTPGGTNRTDPTPRADAIAALGGNAASTVAGDPALLAQATRYGTAPGIRQDLAAADLDYRRDNDSRFLERIGGVSTYHRAYRPQSLDQQRELARWRAAGARTVAAPPETD